MASYIDVLKNCCISNKPYTYLEIGVGHGDSLKALIQGAVKPSNIIAIDPSIDSLDPFVKTSVPIRQTTSDEFFRTTPPIKIDIAFIDGMHLFEYALRDFINCEKHSHTGTIIFFHDVKPRGAHTVSRDLASLPYKSLTKAWNGDVWKIVPILKTYRPDRILTVHDVKDGLLEVTGLDPHSTILQDNYDRIYNQYVGLSYESYVECSRTNDLMAFCTAAQNNGDVYRKRVLTWFDMLKDKLPDADFYCGVDGTLPGGSIPGVTLMQFQPVLGRRNVRVFPGWRRSYGKLLEVSVKKKYPYVVHIENDVTIKNWDKVCEYIYKTGLYSGMCKNYNFIEAAFQVLNDMDIRKELANKYTSDVGINESTLFEDELQKYPFEYPFDTIRIHDKRGSQLYTGNEDFLCQSC